MRTANHEQASQKPTETKAKILVIDDDPAVLDALEVVLAHPGWEITPAASGGMALEAAKKVHFDLAITDLRMPGMSGLETLVALRRLDPILPVIIASGFVTAEDASEYAGLGVFDCIRKPFELEDLLGMVARALHREGTAPAS